MEDRADIPAVIMAIIEETFCTDSSRVSRETTAGDIDGWDSLAHTVLMVRLEKRLGIRISEEIAAKACSVGELIDMLCLEAQAEGSR